MKPMHSQDFRTFVINRPYISCVKRPFDVIFAAAGIVLASPLFVLCPIIIKLDSPGPAYYRQQRVGRYGRPFLIWKFRSMVASSPSLGSKITAAGDPRVTRVGRWLRRMKIDEVPQLLNVLAGDMSLVGPRPEVAEYVEGYTAEQRRVLDFRPGITGPAAIGFICEEELLSGQVNPDSFYRNSVLPKKLELDLAYCAGATLSQDFALLASTVGQIVFHAKNR